MLRLIAKDPNTNGENCPTVWVDEDAEELVFQGWKPDEATAVQCRQARSRRPRPWCGFR